jgi:hypothetical protein
VAIKIQNYFIISPVIEEIENIFGKFRMSSVRSIMDKRRSKKRHYSYFKGTIVDYDSYIVDQVSSTSLFPRLVNVHDSLLLESPCSKEEIWDVLKYFAKDRSQALMVGRWSFLFTFLSW